MNRWLQNSLQFHYWHKHRGCHPLKSLHISFLKRHYSQIILHQTQKMMDFTLVTNLTSIYTYLNHCPRPLANICKSHQIQPHKIYTNLGKKLSVCHKIFRTQKSKTLYRQIHGNLARCQRVKTKKANRPWCSCTDFAESLGKFQIIIRTRFFPEWCFSKWNGSWHNRWCMFL